eukprot:9468952-Pyramimonas_sp.AAC.1
MPPKKGPVSPPDTGGVCPSQTESPCCCVVQTLLPALSVAPPVAAFRRFKVNEWAGQSTSKSTDPWVVLGIKDGAPITKVHMPSYD